MIKLLEYKFDQTVEPDLLPALDSAGNIATEDTRNGDIVTRIIQIEETGLPNRIQFHTKPALLELNYINTSNITNMHEMFYKCEHLTKVDFSHSDTSNVTNMYRVFYGCSSLREIDLSNLNTSKVETMGSMFNGCSQLENLNFDIDASRLTDLSQLFSGCRALVNLELNFLTTSSALRTIAFMFNGCSNLTSLDLSYLDVSNVTSMQSVFTGCRSLTTLNLKGWNTEKVTIMHGMFDSCSLLESLDLSGFRTPSLTNMYSMFARCSSLKWLDLSSFDTSKVTAMNSLFFNCSSLKTLNVSSLNTSNATTLQGVFQGCSSLTELDLSRWNTGLVTNMSNLFDNCNSLMSINLSNWDTSNVTNMYAMFSNCRLLASIDVSSFNTSKVTNMQSMFNQCSSLVELNLSNFDTQSVTTFLYFLSGCSKLKYVNVSSFNTSKAYSLGGFFNGCDSLESLDVSHFDDTSAESLLYFIGSCRSLKRLDLSGIKGSKINTISYFAVAATSLESLDISNLKLNEEIDVATVLSFNQCHNLKEIGMLYSDAYTINKIASLLPNHEKTIYYLDANPNELIEANGAKFVKYKSTTLSLNEEVILRGIDNIKDELDLTTGRLTQRIGVYTITGDESWHYTGGSARRLQISNPDFLPDIKCGALACDCLEAIQANDSRLHGTSGNYYVGYTSDKYIRIILDEKIDCLESGKDWLRANRPTIYYQLVTPIIKTVDTSIINQDQQSSSRLSTFSDTTHITTDSKGGSLISTISHQNPSYPTILKPSTKYSIVADADSNGYDNSPIYFSLGGANISTAVGERVATVTTPNTLTNQLLTMRGVGNKLSNVMVVEGEIVGDEKYFEGMCDVKHPKIYNCGKNLFDGVVKQTSYVKLATHSGRRCVKIQTLNNKNGIFEFTRPFDMSKGDLNITFEFFITNYLTLTPIYTDGSVGPSCGSWSTLPPFTRRTHTIKRNNKFLKGFYTTSSGAAAHCYVDLDSFIIEYNDTSSYEPHQSNVTTFSQEDGSIVTLRGIGDARDILDVATGECIQKVKEITFDGSEGEEWGINYIMTDNDWLVVQITLEDEPISPVLKAEEWLCDKLPTEYGHTWTKRRKVMINDKLLVFVEKSIAQELSEFKEWLSNSPITIQYPLKTSIAKNINIQGFPFAYQNGYVELLGDDEGQSLTPKIEYQVQTSQTGVIQSNQDRLSNHTKRLSALEALLLGQLINQEYNRAKCIFLSQVRQTIEGGVKMHHTKYDLLLEFIDKKLYRSLDEVYEMLDVYFMLGDITDGEYDSLYDLLIPFSNDEEA